MYKCHSYPKMSFDVFRCLVCRRLVFFCVAGPFIARCPGGPTVSIADWSKFCPVDFNRDSPVCLIFLPCTTSPAIFNPVFKASRPRVFAPFFNKGMAALKKKARGKSRACAEPTSGQGHFWSRDCHFRSKGPTRADMAQLPVAHAQNILLDRVTSGHVTSTRHFRLLHRK